nr:putative capsid [Marmot picobirnavirus]
MSKQPNSRRSGSSAASKSRNKVSSPRNSKRREKQSIGRFDSQECLSQTNDYSWYSNFPQFTKDAGTIAFGVPLGNPIALDQKDNFAVPGLIRLSFYPTIGYSKDLSSPINRSAVRFYTYLRNIQKAAARYDSADIMMYLMALDSCYMFHSMLRRAYGIAQLYTPINKYYPKRMFQMMGFDPSIMDNLAEFRAYINRFAISLGSYTVPGNIDMFNRHQWMCEGMYLDSNTTRAQTYFFVPEGFWQFNNTVTTGSELDFVPWLPQTQGVGEAQIQLHTLAQIQDIGNSLINAILNDQDTGDISGDIYAAFGATGTKKLVETSEDFMILPVYDEVVLSQIENATIVGKAWNVERQPEKGYMFKISQDPMVNNGAILFQPAFLGSGGNLGTSAKPLYYNVAINRGNGLINMHNDHPTPEQVIEATRLMVIGEDVYTSGHLNGSSFVSSRIGADVVSSMLLGVLNPTTGALSSLAIFTNGIYNPSDAVVAAGDGTSSSIDVQSMALLSNFDFHPLRWVWNAGDDWSTNVVANVTQVQGDIDNLTTVSGQQLSVMHEAVLLSLFDVPQMGM